MNLKIILIASFGAAMLELIYWYELRKRLENRRYRKLLRSIWYWLIVIAFILGSGLATWIWYGMEPTGRMSRAPREYLLLGAVMPLLFKKAVSTFFSNGTSKLGSDESSLWKDYFQAQPLR